MPYGDWEPAQHRWVSEEVEWDMLVGLMLCQRKGLPRQLVVQHLLPYICSLPRPYELSELMHL